MNKKILLSIAIVSTFLIIGAVLFFMLRATEIKISISVADEKLTGISGVEVALDGEAAKQTNDEGLVVYRLRVKEGQSFTVKAKKAGQTVDSTRTLTITQAHLANEGARINFIFSTISNQPPRVSISADSLSGFTPFNVYFTSTASDPEGALLTYQWSFGDGGLSSEANPQHEYNAQGQFPVSLTVKDDKGATATSNTVTIAVTEPKKPQVTTEPVNKLPKVNIAQTTYSGHAPFTVSFTVSANDPDGAVTSYIWSFGDGTAGSSEQNPQHTFTKAGKFRAVVTVTDNKGGKASASASVHVKEPPPKPVEKTKPVISEVNAKPLEGDAPLKVDFSVVANDADGSIKSYQWQFGDGEQSDKLNPSHTYKAERKYKASVTVTDNDNLSKTETITITVRRKPLPLSIDNITAQPGEAEIGTAITFSATTKNAIGALSYEWDFQDGGKSKEGMPKHSFSKVGTYTVTLTAKDSKNNTTTKNYTVTIKDKKLPPIDESKKDSSSSATVNCQAKLNEAQQSYDKKNDSKVEDILSRITDEQCGDDDYVEILGLRGRALFRRERYEEANVLLEQALKIDPCHPFLLLNHAQVHQKLGDYVGSNAILDAAAGGCEVHVPLEKRWEFEGDILFERSLNLYLQWLFAPQAQKPKLCNQAIKSFEDFINKYCGDRAHPKCEDARRMKDELVKQC
ncbi:MAG: PKD domain-containing protein [Bacteroidetes bacterium]|nr:MAG: PKD domain-containing protein [Bacteroidota bacterium]